MKGTDILQSLPCQAGQKREDAILEHVRAGHYVDICWSAIKTEFNGHVGSIMVSSDVLKLGEPDDFFRPNVTAATAQKIADELNVLLPTTLICDQCYLQRTAQATPCLQPADPVERKRQGYPECPDGTTSMSDTPAMAAHSKHVTDKQGQQLGLLCNVGKHWVISNVLLNKPAATAANYGWFDPNGPYTTNSGFKCWQPLSTFHNDKHTDYSQVQPRFVGKTMTVDGLEVEIFNVGRDPELWGLVSSEGVVKVWRQRSVPEPGEPEPPPTEPLPPNEPDLTFTRLLHLQSPRMTGDDVRQWQRFLSITPDSIFGLQTDSATSAFQLSHKDPRTDEPLAVDGVVGPSTVRSANEVLRQRSEVHDGAPGLLVDDFVRAKNYTPQAGPREIKWIVVHTAELAEKLTSAEALAAWAAGAAAPKASWHFAVDCDSIVQSVDVDDIAWHAPGANKHGIGVEHAGYARQSEEDWFDDYSRDMLLRSARLFAWLCNNYAVPVRFVDREGLKRGDQGITTHNEVSFAFHKTDHTDPGPHFPMDWFLEQIRAHMER